MLHKLNKRPSRRVIVASAQRREANLRALVRVALRQVRAEQERAPKQELSDAA